MNLRRVLHQLSTLQIALLVSVAVHAVVLTVRFVDPVAFNRVFEDTPLEVILVNAKSAERPDKALAIAQANLAGGGEAAQGRATSPLPPAQRSDIGEAMEEAQRRMEAMQEQQTVLLAQINRMLAALPPPPDPSKASTQAQDQAQEEKRRQLLKHLAEIERRIQLENTRPKRRVVSPSTREEVYAIYYDALRRKVEDKGTEHFPELNGKKLYGELVMIVTVDHLGRVLATEIAQSSGNRTLDRRAEAIARSAAPFGPFNEAMRRKADEILVVSRFRFTREATLETKLSAQ